MNAPLAVAFVAFGSAALSCIVIGVYRLVDRIGQQSGWWQ